MEPQFENVLDSDLGNGTYQILVLLIAFLFAFSATDSIAINFLAGKIDFRCFQKEVNNDVGHAWNFSTTANIIGNDSVTTNPGFVRVSTCSGACSRPVYERSVFFSSIVSEFDLVCQRAWLVDLISTIYMAGRLLSCLTHGYLADRYGRKKVLIGSHAVKLIGGVMSIYSGNYVTFAISRFVIAVGSTASCMASFVLQLTGSAWRKRLGVIFNISLSIGGMVLSLIAYLVRDFRKLQAVYTWPQFPLLLCYVILDESPRWLATRGRIKDARRCLQKMALVNRYKDLTIDSIRYDNAVTRSDGRGRMLKFISGFFDGKALSMKTIILWFAWWVSFVASLIYYALSLNTGRLPGNIYINTFFINLVEVPASPVTIWALERFGGRLTLAVFTVSAAVSCFLMVPFMFFPEGKYVVTALGILGKGLITVTYNALYVETAETYQTKVRSQAMGIAASFGRLSSMASSFLGGFMADIWPPLPSVIFGSFALLSGFSFFLFPRIHTGDLHVTDKTSDGKQESPMIRKDVEETTA